MKQEQPLLDLNQVHSNYSNNVNDSTSVTLGKDNSTAEIKRFNDRKSIKHDPLENMRTNSSNISASNSDIYQLHMTSVMPFQKDDNQSCPPTQNRDRHN